jgi:putative ABC transport system permease protein
VSRWRSAQTHKSVADIVKRRTHSLLVMFAIALAVGGLVAVTVADQGLSAAYAFTVRAQGTRPDVVVAVDRADDELVAEVGRLPNVATVQQATTMSTEWHVATAPGHVSFTVISYPDLARVALTPFELLQGRYPGAGEIVMEFGDSALQPFGLGDTVTVDTAGGTVSLRVVGIARTSGLNPAITDKAVGYMSSAGLQRLPAYTYEPGQVPRQPLLTQQLSVKLWAPAEFQGAADSVVSVVRARGDNVLAVFPPEQGAPISQLRGVFSLVRVLLAVAVLLAAILLLNTITALVTEQVAIIGTMKALGATRGRIVRGYLTTVALYSAVATPLGVGVGIGGGWLLTSKLAAAIPLATGPFSVSPGVVVLGIGVGFGVPAIAALIPLWLGTRISVREALAAWGVASVEAAQAGAASRLLGRLARVARVPHTFSLGLRGLFRKPWRAALSVTTVSVAAMSFLVVQTMAASVSATIASVWGNFDADVEVYVGDPHSYSTVAALLSTVPDVGRIERVAWRGVPSTWGKLALWGVEPDSQLYHHQLVSGRWFTDGDTGVVVLDDQFAHRAGLRIGSMLPLTAPGGTGQVNWTVIGTVHEPVDDLSQAGAVVVPVSQLHQFAGATAVGIADFTDRIIVQSKDRSTAGVDRLTRAIDTVGRAAGPGRDGPIAEVFMFRDEVTRQQRNFTPLYAMLIAVAVVVAIVGALGLADALGSSVVDRQKDIGLLRALGATGRRVAEVFWVEALVIGALAWLVACLAGVPLAFLFVGLFQRRVMPVEFRFEPLAFAAALAATLAVATLASVGPALKAAALRAVDLLRYQ